MLVFGHCKCYLKLLGHQINLHVKNKTLFGKTCTIDCKLLLKKKTIVWYFKTFLHNFEIWNHRLKKTLRQTYLYIFIIILQNIIGRSITVIIYL